MADSVNGCDENRKLMVDHALSWANRGLKVFPLQPRSKVPFPGTRGCKDASLSETKIKAWWAKAPDSNIGIATGNGFFVVDLDGEEAENWYVDALGRHGAHPETLTVSTARGWHMFFKTTKRVPNSAGLIAPHIDVRGAGGYVVGAPSIHPDGHVYALVKPAEIVPAPQWLVDLAIPDRTPPPGPPPTLPKDPVPGIVGLVHAVVHAPEGQRNALLFWASCRMAELVAAHKIEPLLARQLLFEAGRANGLNPREVNLTLNSAFSKRR